MCCEGRHLAETSSSELDGTAHVQHVSECWWLHSQKLHSMTSDWLLAQHSTSQTHEVSTNICPQLHILRRRSTASWCCAGSSWLSIGRWCQRQCCHKMFFSQPQLKTGLSGNSSDSQDRKYNLEKLSRCADAKPLCYLIVEKYFTFSVPIRLAGTRGRFRSQTGVWWFPRNWHVDANSDLLKSFKHYCWLMSSLMWPQRRKCFQWYLILGKSATEWEHDSAPFPPPLQWNSDTALLLEWQPTLIQIMK